MPSTDVDTIKELYLSGNLTLNLVDPPQMDTVMVPGAGYAILRFKANNPGKCLIAIYY